MNHEFWIKQTIDKPLFPELLWSRPENRQQAGKLLIVGGNSWGFAAPALAYDEAVKAGIGAARVLLPAAVHKVIGHAMEHAESATSTPSGSFSQQALAELLEQASWSDGVLVAGDLGRNSETAILLEKFLNTFTGQVSLTKDAVDYAINFSDLILNRTQTTLILSMGQLQKLATAAHFDQALTSSMDLIRLVDTLHTFTEKFPISLVVKHYQNIVITTKGQVSTTKLIEERPIWRVSTAAHIATWWLQNSSKSFEAMTTAAIAMQSQSE